MDTVFEIFECSETKHPTWLLTIGHPYINKEKGYDPGRWYPWCGLSIKFSKTGYQCLSSNRHWEHQVLGSASSFSMTIDVVSNSNNYVGHYVFDFIKEVGFNNQTPAAFREFMSKRYGWVKEREAHKWEDWVLEYYNKGDFHDIILCG